MITAETFKFSSRFNSFQDDRQEVRFFFGCECRVDVQKSGFFWNVRFKGLDWGELDLG